MCAPETNTEINSNFELISVINVFGAIIRSLEREQIFDLPSGSSEIKS